MLEHSAGVGTAVVVDEEHEAPPVQPGDDGLSTIRATDEQRGRVWWVKVSEARRGHYRVGIEGIPAVFAMRPEQLLVPGL